MPVYFIETIIDSSRSSDNTGMIFNDAEDAIKVAFWAIFDILNDEAGIRTELDVTVVVKDFNRDVIFNATLQAGRRLHSGIRVEMPVITETPAPKLRLSR